MKSLFSDKCVLRYQQRINRLRGFTLVFLTLLLTPISLVLYKGYTQFEQDLLTEYQNKTQEITSQLNLRLFKRIVFDNALSTREFDHYQHIYNPNNKQISRVPSPLANPNYHTRFTGLIGYFQLDKEGNFNSPVWPHTIKSSERLISPQDDKEMRERKKIALNLYNITAKSNELKTLIDHNLSANNEKFLLLSDVAGYLIFYRIVSVNDKKQLQGYIIDVEAYLNEQIANTLKTVLFKNTIAVTVAPNRTNADNVYLIYKSNPQGTSSITSTKHLDDQLTQQVLNSHALRWPFKDYKLTYSTSQLILPLAATYSLGLMALLVLGIVLGCYGFYHLGVKQLRLAEQRLNFVSSVSHELKTPLTSIRMYSEMLKSGMVPSEEYKLEYYEFIHCESERLSRLIDNILQLSKLSQPQHTVEPQYTKLSILIDIIHSKVSSLVVKNAFQLDMLNDFNDPDNVLVLVDLDAFSQVVINITDNAVKFFDHDTIQDKARQKIDFIFKVDPKNKDQLCMEIRDYGDGISAEQQSKIFELFYRGGSELTRSTQGTGIGLALVNELVSAQQGTIQVERMSPGLSMKVCFKYKTL
ncbi:two-component system, OmpR family, sensor histidine kinase KdpD [Pseudoalteromonas citrea]|uniref:histidine kinase n=2 Tax=Pseudoalteromonas citrea TaxID=43655 RepID=A0AAD4FS40_9GAMM|nr:HAMP domain-containing sensor histidine kinase [Pseudoalteromonas citrea]KAF7771908.1 two-component system, OmpR family, sensor histidine kinase KdpD [Pseudoalteromonas citrea]